MYAIYHFQKMKKIKLLKVNMMVCGLEKYRIFPRNLTNLFTNGNILSYNCFTDTAFLVSYCNYFVFEHIKKLLSHNHQLAVDM